MNSTRMAIASLLLAVAAPALGEIIRRIDPAGTVLLSNAPPADSQASGDAGATAPSPAIDPSDGAPEGPPPGCRSPAAGVLTHYPSVEIFSRPKCPWGEKARQFFERNRVPFRYFDIDADRDAAARLEAFVKSMGADHASIPTVVIGRALISGFRPDAYWRALCTER